MQEYIAIKGANVSLRIPKRKITIFTGVSGSGKSSIAGQSVTGTYLRESLEKGGGSFEAGPAVFDHDDAIEPQKN
ncbi:hypothetical protein [Paenibacillus tyrfis]|uniref:hypothetical protein n=1 Tax=Paenibacillus tyrfis TaxID=1501230 RepID=UPI00209E4FD9|nr:hypothetical protein [Paenibacillus tyrfis]MCP1308830.1 hypothetical protein [Paenibacillus tyrfis]